MRDILAASSTASLPVSPYSVGVKVRSRWQNSEGQYYNATVAAVNADGTFEIDYQDGDHDSNVEASRLSLEPWVRHHDGFHSSDTDEMSEEASDREGEGMSRYIIPRMSGSELDRLDRLLPLSPTQKMRMQEEQFQIWVRARHEESIVQDLAYPDANPDDKEDAEEANDNDGAPNSKPDSADDSTSDKCEASEATKAPATSGVPLLRAASDDPVLRDMKFDGRRPFLGSPEARAASFKEHKAKFLAYALKRYNELERYRSDDGEGDN